MIKRRTTLEEALSEIESGSLLGVTAIVVNRQWWLELPSRAQTGFRKRCSDLRLVLSVDNALSTHFVELATDPDEPPLSTERRV